MNTNIMTEGKTTKKSRRSTQSNGEGKRGKTRTGGRSRKKSREKSPGNSSSSEDDGDIRCYILEITNGISDCPHCGSHFKIHKDPPRVYARHANDEERKDAANASKKRWEERNKNRVRELNKLRARRYRERKKQEIE